MFFLFTSLLIFIPYLNKEAVVPILSEYEISLLSDQVDVIAIALDLNDDSDLNIERYNSIKNAAIYFQDFEFSLLDQDFSEYLSKEQEISIPSIFYISKGEILASYPFPETETAFLHLCKLFTTTVTTITSLSDLYCSLTDNPFTILSTCEHFNSSLQLQMSLGRELGFMDIKTVTSEILSLLGLSDKTIALFRREDKTVISTLCDKESIQNSSIPIYRILMPSDLLSRGDGKLVFSLFCDFLGDEEDDFLYELGEKYGEFVIVGYGINVEDYASKFLEGVGGNENHQIIVFDYENGFYYNASNYFDKFFGLSFSVSEWNKSASTMLDNIINNKTSPIYISETLDNSENSEFVSKIVGLNYEEFVMDKNFDVLILYKREGCHHCSDFYPVFEKFAEDCLVKENLDFLKFGFIDIDKNASPKKFPFMIGVPHVQFFPAKNKSDDRPLRGERDRDSLIRLIKENSEREIPFDVQPADKSQLAMEMMQMLLLMDQISENDRDKLIGDMNKLAEDLKKLDEKNIDEIKDNDFRDEKRNDML